MGHKHNTYTRTLTVTHIGIFGTSEQQTFEPQLIQLHHTHYSEMQEALNSPKLDE